MLLTREMRDIGRKKIFYNSSKKCVDDALIITELLKNYDKHQLPGGTSVKVSVEVISNSITACIKRESFKLYLSHSCKPL